MATLGSPLEKMPLVAFIDSKQAIIMFVISILSTIIQLDLPSIVKGLGVEILNGFAWFY
jgi:hypothetical protein